MTSHKNPLTSYKPTKNENFLFCAIVAITSLVYLSHYYSKNRTALAELDKSIAAEKAELAKNQVLKGQLASKNPALTGAPEAHAMYDKYIAANTSFSSVIDALAKGDGKSPFEVNKIAIEKQEQANGYNKTLLNIDVEASFMAIGGFLESVEQSPLLTEVQEVEIDRINSELKKCTAKIKLLSYVMRK